MEQTSTDSQFPYIAPIPRHFQVVDFIRELAVQLQISQRCLATALTYLLMMRRSDFLSAAASVFLACKVLQQPRSLCKILTAYYFLYAKDLQARHPKLVVHPLSPYTRTSLERELKKRQFEILEGIGFNCVVDLPYDYIEKFQYSEIYELKKIAAFYANDSFRTSVAIWWSGEEIAKACLVLAAEFLDVDLSLTCSRQVYDILKGLYSN